MNDINLQIDYLYNNLLYVIKKSQLPIGIVYFILNKIYTEKQKQYYGTLNSLVLQQQELTGKEFDSSNIKQEKEDFIIKDQEN